jgi:hypothetical protein
MDVDISRSPVKTINMDRQTIQSMWWFLTFWNGCMEKGLMPREVLWTYDAEYVQVDRERYAHLNFYNDGDYTEFCLRWIQ